MNEVDNRVTRPQCYCDNVGTKTGVRHMLRAAATEAGALISQAK